MTTISPLKEVADAVREAGGEALKSCYQCGTCTATCPWGLVRNFAIRRIIHQTQLGLSDLESEEIWLCATCKACVDRCPRDVQIIDIWKALRRVIAEMGVAEVPESLRISIKNISAVGNPLGESPETRADWAQGLTVKKFTPGMDLLYFSCCIPAYDPKVKRVAVAVAGILKKAGVDFGILGDGEMCCGEAVRKAGNERLFQTLAASNSRLFAENNVSKILTSSPHCYNTYQSEYPQLEGITETIHVSQYLLELINEDRIKPVRELKKRVAYHDPCYLGRHNGIYDEPRQLLKSIPGLELVELPDTREDSLCCGGGGGRIWTETKKGERFSDLRIEQAIEVGADILAVACPYCLLNFEDSVLSMGREDSLVISDIAELVGGAL